MVLGPLVDQNFRRTLIIFKDQSVMDVLLRPVGLLMLVVVVVTIAGALYGGRRSAQVPEKRHLRDDET
jgi:TctA family transporter